jgi:hypothetical protein
MAHITTQTGPQKDNSNNNHLWEAAWQHKLGTSPKDDRERYERPAKP